MNKIYRLIALTICILSGYLAYAQSPATVSGKVTDADGEPIIGAAVMVKGHSSAGAVTDLDGKYTLKLPASAGDKVTLTVTCLSYETQNKSVGNKSVINFVLQEDAEHLDEVVVVGYGAMRRSDLTGSVTSVKIDDSEAGTSSTFDELLKGRAAGVNVISSSASPDAAVSIRVRGTTSLNGSNEPLYVVDGVIMSTPENVSMFTQDNMGGSDEALNAMMGINPQDIASMEILKDASATAIYGSAGANGVVLITTKTANRDRPVINFNAGIDIAKRYKTIDVLSYDEWYQYTLDQGASPDGLYRTDLDTGEFILDANGEKIPKYRGANWQDEILQTAISQRYYFSVSGRPDTYSYNFSVGYNGKEGIVPMTGAEQYTVRLNVTKQLFKNFSIGTKSNLSYIHSRISQGMSTTTLDGASSMMRSLIISRPYRKISSNLNDDEDIDDNDQAFKETPARWLSDYQSIRKEFRITPSLFVDWKIVPWLSFKSTFGGDYRLLDRTRWKGYTINYGAGGSIGSNSSQDTYRWNWDNTLNFSKKWNKHRVNATLGTATTRSHSITDVIEGWNIPEHKPQHLGLNTAENTRLGINELATAQQSYFVRGMYNYDDRYLLTATYRIDGSSRFSKANRYATFPSFAFAWRLSEEPWLKNVEWLEMAKIRVGWGQVGNSAVGSYQIYSTFGGKNYPDHTVGNNSEYTPGLIPTNISNSGLKWETTEQWNAGIDIGLWEGRLSLTVDMYDKLTRDLLQSRTISTSSGFSSMWVNNGSIRNRGLEISLDATPVLIGDFEWNVGGNISFNRNSIVSLGNSGNGGDIYISPDNMQNCIYYLGDVIGTSNYMKYPANIFIEGYPVGLFYGIKTDGLVQEGQKGIPNSQGGTERDPGSINYVDVNGNGYLDDNDRTIIGDPNPDFTYGFSTSFRYKGLRLSASFNGSYGNELINANLAQELNTRNAGTSSTSFSNIRREAYFDAWTPENPDARYPKLGSYNLEEQRLFTDRFVEDASYLRISNVSFSYDIPIPKNKVLKGLNLGISGRNLYVFTKYSGWDPEVSSYGNNMKKIGVDTGSYPGARTYSFDLKFTF